MRFRACAKTLNECYAYAVQIPYARHVLRKSPILREILPKSPYALHVLRKSSSMLREVKRMFQNFPSKSPLNPIFIVNRNISRAVKKLQRFLDTYYRYPIGPITNKQ